MSEEQKQDPVEEKIAAVLKDEDSPIAEYKLGVDEEKVLNAVSPSLNRTSFTKVVMSNVSKDTGVNYVLVSNIFDTLVERNIVEEGPKDGRSRTFRLPAKMETVYIDNQIIVRTPAGTEMLAAFELFDSVLGKTEEGKPKLEKAAPTRDIDKVMEAYRPRRYTDEDELTDTDIEDGWYDDPETDDTSYYINVGGELKDIQTLPTMTIRRYIRDNGIADTITGSLIKKSRDGLIDMIIEHDKEKPGTSVGTGTAKASPDVFFQYVKSIFTDQQLEDLNRRLELVINVLRSSEITGQRRLYESMMEEIIKCVREQEAVVAGYTKYIYTDTIESLMKAVKEDIHLVKLHDFTRPLPKPVVDKIVNVKQSKLFDILYVLCTGSPEAKGKKTKIETNTKGSNLTTEEKIRKKDPILFGKMPKNGKLFYITDWVDEYCGLTMDKFVSEVKKIYPGYVLPELGEIDDKYRQDMVDAIKEDYSRKLRAIKNTTSSNYNKLASKEKRLSVEREAEARKRYAMLRDKAIKITQQEKGWIDDITEKK
jgi:hypothetical protein